VSTTPQTKHSLNVVYQGQILAIGHKVLHNYTDWNKLTHPGPTKQLAPRILPLVYCHGMALEL